MILTRLKYKNDYNKRITNWAKGGCHRKALLYVHSIIYSMGLPFASRKVVNDFLLATFLIVVVPLVVVGVSNIYLK